MEKYHQMVGMLNKGEINEYFKTDKEFCRYCNYAKESAPWRLSKGELSEWYDIQAIMERRDFLKYLFSI